MNLVKTTAPISIDNLKLYFTDKSTFYIIDYKNSTLKGSKLLTYLSNLDIPCDIDLSDLNNTEVYDLVLDYMKTPMLVNINRLELLVIYLLKEYKGIVKNNDSDFINANIDIFKIWESKLDSLSLYNLYIINSDELKTFVTTHQEDDTNDLCGVNFLKVLKHQDFYEYYGFVKQDNLKYYSKYFNDYMFKGKNLYEYWANDNNPMFLLTTGIVTGELTSEEYNKAKKQSIEEFSNATFI